VSRNIRRRRQNASLAWTGSTSPRSARAYGRHDARGIPLLSSSLRSCRGSGTCENRRRRSLGRLIILNRRHPTVTRLHGRRHVCRERRAPNTVRSPRQPQPPIQAPFASGGHSRESRRRSDRRPTREPPR